MAPVAGADRRSFMSVEFKEQYKTLLKERMDRSFQP